MTRLAGNTPHFLFHTLTHIHTHTRENTGQPHRSSTATKCHLTQVETGSVKGLQTLPQMRKINAQPALSIEGFERDRLTRAMNPKRLAGVSLFRVFLSIIKW